MSEISLAEVLWFIIFESIENCLEKEKMLVTNIFSLSHNVFKSFLFAGYENLWLCNKQLTRKKRTDLLVDCILLNATLN